MLASPMVLFWVIMLLCNYVIIDDVSITNDNIIAPVPHLNKSLAQFNKNPLHQGFLTGIATINLFKF